jgi:hypothetical protein
MNIVKYTVDLEKRLCNVSSLPHGTGCKFLVCINSHNNTLIAKRWLRKRPKLIMSHETLVIF